MTPNKPSSREALNAIRQDFYAAGDASRVLHSRTALVDEVVAGAFRQILEPAFPEGVALLAVGGYGRRELFPFSDVDLLILCDKGIQGKDQKEALSIFLRELWDAGLRLSHSVRTVPECCEVHDQNVELNISLLDQRLLAGDKRLYEVLAARLPKFLRSRYQDLGKHLCRLARSRHAKFQDTIFHMEPNIKEAPGGLRDFHIIWWLDRLQNPDPGASEWGMQGVDRHSALSPARDFLFAMRAFLHYQIGRDHNQLTFELQDELAQQSFTEGANVEALMRNYFRHARDVHRAALRAMEAAEGPDGTLLAQFRDWRSRLSNSEFSVVRERVYLKAPAMLTVDPEIVVRLFQFVARHGFRLSHDAERRIAAAMPTIAKHFATPHPLWSGLRELLSLPHTALALESMSETGVLAAIFPEWKRIECLVVRDFYHRFTVDAHTLQAVRALLELRDSTDLDRRRFAGLLAEVDQPAILVLALLFHDIGKGGGEGKHVQEAKPLLDSAMKRIQAPQAVSEQVWALIENHLALSGVMTSRDLDDPATSMDIADSLGTEEQIKNLALLTYADISAVNPSAMTPWRLEQLWRAYLCAHREVTRELETARIDAPAAVSPDLAEFLAGFPKRYIRTHGEEEMRRHFELEVRARELGVAVDIRKNGGVFEAAIVAQDRTGLFASVAGALAAFGVNILKAEAFANKRGKILDTFTFSDPGRNLELNPSEIDRLRLSIERVVLGRTDVKELLRNRPKPAPLSRHSRLHPSVAFDGEASAKCTLIEIVAEDRPGLLYDLAGQISTAGCNIEVVLIDTKANKALDVFYVTRAGAKLDSEAMSDLKDRLLAVCAPLAA